MFFGWFQSIKNTANVKQSPKDPRNYPKNGKRTQQGWLSGRSLHFTKNEKDKKTSEGKMK